MAVSEEKHTGEAYCYKIDGMVDFYPSENALYNDITNESVILLSTASACLQILIEEHGNIISRQELTERVWGKKGVIVSSNTYYQTMLTLRRGIEKSGVVNNVIATIYGKGSKIDESVEIIKIDISNDRIKNYKLIHNSPLMDDIQEKKDSLIDLEKTKEIGNIKLRWIVVNITLLLIFALFFYINSFVKRENFFKSYYKLPSAHKGCSLYIESESIINKSLNKDVKAYDTKCKDGEKIYISSPFPVSRMSIIHCSGDFLPGEQCESDFYLK